MNNATHNEMSVNKAWSGRGTLKDLVAELYRQKATKLDVCVDVREMFVRAEKGGANDGGLSLCPNSAQSSEFLPATGLPISTSALCQIGERVEPNIPAKFAKEIAEKRPGRAAELFSGLMHDTGKRNLVRCLDGRVRAFLSDKYRVLENYDVAFAALDVARAKGAEVLEASLSDKTMRIKMVCREVWDVIDATRAGDKGGWFTGGLGSNEYLGRVAARSGGELPGGAGTIWPVVTIGNSETGHGGLFARLGILHGVCFNLATVESVVAQVHLGEKVAAGVLTAEAIQADSKAIMLKVRDSIASAFDLKKFKEIVARIKGANEDQIAAPSLAVGNLIENTDLPESARDSILEHFLRDYKATRYGLSQAVARAAQDVADGDDAAGMEAIAGKLVEVGGGSLLN